MDVVGVKSIDPLRYKSLEIHYVRLSVGFILRRRGPFRDFLYVRTQKSAFPPYNVILIYILCSMLTMRRLGFSNDEGELQ